MRLRFPPLSLPALRQRLQTDDYLPRRRLELPFIASLAVLAVLVIGAYVIEQSDATKQQGDARVINTAGRQRMLTERIAFLTTRLATTGSPVQQRRDRIALRTAARTMRADNEILVAQPEVLGAGPAPQLVQDLRDRNRLTPRIERFTSDALAIARPGATPTVGNPRVQRIMAAARGPLLQDLERQVRAYEEATVASARSLSWVLFVSTGLIVSGLIIIGALIFWPLARRMREEISTVGLLEEIAVAANGAKSIDEAYAKCLQLVCAHVGWPLGHVYLPDADGNARSTDIWHLEDRSKYGSFVEVTKRMTLPKGVGLPGRVIVSGKPAWIADVRVDPNFPRAPQAVTSGLVSAMAFPVTIQDEVVGVVEAFAHHKIKPAPRLLRILTQVGVQLGRVIERDRHQRDLAHRALHDELTGLPNRTLLLEHVAAAQARSRRSGDVLALLLLDLDNFKLTNDALGHQIGDQMLAAVGERLATGMRAMDIVARFSADEFAILCEGLKDEAEADELARRVQFLLQQQVSVDGRWMSVSASIGIAIGRGGEAPEDLLRDADTAMYAAKRRARGMYARFDASMREEISERLRLADELVGAASRGELRLFLQPIVDLESNRLRAFEALVRWEHPLHGLVPPGVFIPLAEDSGIIGEIGTWVLRESARWAAQIHPGVYLSVNLSTRQLEDPMIVETVRQALEEHQVPPGRLTLEVTESVLLDGQDEQLKRLEALRATGARISLDDFGTGYSSLSYLQDLPLDVLKLDMSFARRLIDGEDAHASTIIRTVASLAGGLGLDFVVEGIETPEQLARLKALGCQLGQGYLFAKPMAANEAIAYASAGRPDAKPDIQPHQPPHQQAA